MSALFEIYVDSNWESGPSSSGAFYFVYGCLFAWFSKSQRSVSLSSAESEMFGLCLAVKEGLFYRDLLFDLGILGVGPTTVWIDSQGALHLSLDPVAFNPFTHHLATCLKRTLAGRASEDSGGSDGHESSRRWCHNAGRTPARLACAAQRRRSCCSAAATRLEDPSATSAPCSKKML